MIRYVVALNALVFILLSLDPNMLRARSSVPRPSSKGTVWRLVSWIFIPDTLSPISVDLYLMVVWSDLRSPEATWGAFRLNAYLFLGNVLLHRFGPHFSGLGGTCFLTSLFLAVATLARP